MLPIVAPLTFVAMRLLATACLGLLLILMTFAVVGFGLGLPRYLAASRKPDVWGRR